jgi:hypothetical protein
VFSQHFLSIQYILLTVVTMLYTRALELIPPNWNCGGFFIVVVLVGLGFELGALHLQSRHFTAWATLPLHSILVWLFGDMDSRTVCPGWPQIMIPLISTSQVARLPGVSPEKLCSLTSISPVPLPPHPQPLLTTSLDSASVSLTFQILH